MQVQRIAVEASLDKVQNPLLASALFNRICFLSLGHCLSISLFCATSLSPSVCAIFCLPVHSEDALQIEEMMTHGEGQAHRSVVQNFGGKLSVWSGGALGPL